jgi:hypothetical protein
MSYEYVCIMMEKIQSLLFFLQNNDELLLMHVCIDVFCFSFSHCYGIYNATVMLNECPIILADKSGIK